MATHGFDDSERTMDYGESSCEYEYDDADRRPGKRQRLAWTDEENQIILEECRRLGTQWDKIAFMLPGRTADAVRNQCHRLHKTMGTYNSSNEDSDDETCERVTGAAHGRSMWTAEEDRAIMEGVRRFGCKWRRIAALLPGRSDSSVRNRWSRIQEPSSSGGDGDGDDDDDRATLPAPPRPRAPGKRVVTPAIASTASPSAPSASGSPPTCRSHRRASRSTKCSTTTALACCTTAASTPPRSRRRRS